MKEQESQEKKKAMYIHYIETVNKLEQRAHAILVILQEVGEVSLGRHSTILEIDYDIENEILCYSIEDYDDDIYYLEYPLQYLWMDDEDIKKDIVKRREERLKKEAAARAEAERLRQEKMEKEERAIYERLKQKYETEDK